MDTHLLADGSGNAFVIAGKYLDLHASLVELGNCLASALFGGQEGQVANKHHVALHRLRQTRRRREGRSF